MEQTLSPIDRRAFLQMLLGTTAAAAAASLAAPLWGKLTLEPTVATLDLLRVFGNMESATAVGQAYLAQYPQQASVAIVTTDIAKRLLASGYDWRHLSVADLRAALRTQIRHDFAGERTVKLQGWLVSLTEAQLCGLAALSTRDTG
jgi:hypothetical protein